MTISGLDPGNPGAATGQLAEVDWLVRYVQSDGGGNLINSIGDLIRSGRLQAGARLPTVRTLAPLLGVSPATVAGAWSRLRDQGLIETRRRGGTVVAGPGTDAARPGRGPGCDQSWDLAQGLIDYALLPDLGPALLAGLREPSIHRASKEHALPALIEAVAPTWPFAPEAWTTAGSGTEGVLLALKAAADGASTIAVESPTSPRLLDICATLCLELIAVECDVHGPLPVSLRKALARRPSVFLYQSRAQVPLGHAVTATRLVELALELAASPETHVVEDDFFGPLALADASSMGELLPKRTLLVRSYDQAYGIDLRTCVAGGASHLVDRMRSQRSHGAAMNSRILQGALAWLLRDEHTGIVIDRAKGCYAVRRSALLSSLHRHGCRVQGDDGLHLWMEVPREDAAIVALADQGISVGSGSRCQVGAEQGEFLRLSTGQLPNDLATIETVAERIATVIASSSRHQ